MTARQTNRSAFLFIYLNIYKSCSSFYLLNYLICWNDKLSDYSEIYKVFVKDLLDTVNRKAKPFSQDDIDAEYVGG